MASEKAGQARSKRRNPGGRNGSRPLYAAVDLGTNNCRLLIAKPVGTGFRIVDSHSQIARLGEGLAHTGRLSDAAIERAMDALSKIRAKLRARKVAHVRCIATEACRRAENGADFIARVREELGLTFKIIGPGEEARLAMVGCHNLFEEAGEHALVLDIGGGSTELSLVDAAKARRAGGVKNLVSADVIKCWGSLPLGVVTLAEAFSHLDEVEGFEAMRTHAHSVFETWKHGSEVAQALAQPDAQIIGTSGTVTCLAGVHLGLERYRRDKVDGAWMSRSEASAVIQRLCDLGLEGRAELPTIGEERAGLMLSGCAIVSAAWDLYPAERMRVADRGLREGLLLTMIHGPKRGRQRSRRGGRKRGGAKKGKAAAE
ncbi:MAG: Ppx/GppA family phosphatase [Hyphomonadaceae bacterium]|nr:Ppx/GppA family phosphatase [Hyphomonadaceae bacterium]